MSSLNILCVGDVVGKPGRKVIENHLSEIQEEHNIGFTIINVENSAGGFGITPKIYYELLELDIDVFTSGNHIYCNKDILRKFDEYEKLLRPLNFPKGNPGAGYLICHKDKYKIAVVNLIGRVFVGEYDCPFQAMENYLDEIKKITPNIIIDFHAETTSEKQAMGWFMNGQASLVFGTHTHVMTVDSRILNKGTGYISDIGMVGPNDGVLGMKKEPIINKFFTQMPVRFEPEKDSEMVFNAVKCTIDTQTGRALNIKKIIKLY
ncbi:TIGR00282 family metallophosphoesterase [Candidatus Margulisiibacteriota bacterium]